MKQVLGVLAGLAAGFGLACVAAERRADAQAGPAGGVGAGAPATIVATGGASNNQNDLCWVLTRVKPARGPERTVMALYKAERGGELFNLKDVRFIDADLRLLELDSGKHKPSVQEVLRSLPPEEAELLRPPPRQP
jgi:hypothetical protein